MYFCTSIDINRTEFDSHVPYNASEPDFFLDKSKFPALLLL